MRPQTLARAALALVILVVLWMGARLMRGSLSEDAETLALPELSAGDVDRLTIATADDTLVVAQEGTGWTVNGYPASANAVSEVFDALVDTVYTATLVARSPTSHERMGVDTAAARTATFFGGDEPLLELLVGNRGSDFSSAFVRLAGDDNVYALRGRLSSLLERRRDAWRERRIAQVPRDSVGSVDVMNPGGRYTLTRADSVWTVGGAPAESVTVADLLTELGNVRAAAFPTASDEDSLDFTRPHRRLTVRSRSGNPLLALVFDSIQAGVFGRLDTGGYVWRLDAWRVERLTPPESLLVSGAR